MQPPPNEYDQSDPRYSRGTTPPGSNDLYQQLPPIYATSQRPPEMEMSHPSYNPSGYPQQSTPIEYRYSYSVPPPQHHTEYESRYPPPNQMVDARMEYVHAPQFGAPPPAYDHPSRLPPSMHYHTHPSQMSIHSSNAPGYQTYTYERRRSDDAGANYFSLPPISHQHNFQSGPTPMQGTRPQFPSIPSSYMDTRPDSYAGQSLPPANILRREAAVPLPPPSHEARVIPPPSNHSDPMPLASDARQTLPDAPSSPEVEEEQVEAGETVLPAMRTSRPQPSEQPSSRKEADVVLNYGDGSSADSKAARPHKPGAVQSKSVTRPGSATSSASVPMEKAVSTKSTTKPPPAASLPKSETHIVDKRDPKPFNKPIPVKLNFNSESKGQSSASQTITATPSSSAASTPMTAKPLDSVQIKSVENENESNFSAPPGSNGDQASSTKTSNPPPRYRPPSFARAQSNDTMNVKGVENNTLNELKRKLSDLINSYGKDQDWSFLVEEAKTKNSSNEPPEPRKKLPRRSSSSLSSTSSSSSSKGIPFSHATPIQPAQWSPILVLPGDKAEVRLRTLEVLPLKPGPSFLLDSSLTVEKMLPRSYFGILQQYNVGHTFVFSWPEQDHEFFQEMAGLRKSTYVCIREENANEVWQLHLKPGKERTTIFGYLIRPEDIKKVIRDRADLFFKARKIPLVLDLDDTLVRAVGEETGRYVHPSQVELVQDRVRELKDGRKVVLTHRVHEFLEWAQKYYEISICSLGDQPYVDMVVSVLDPTRTLIRGICYSARAEYEFIQSSSQPKRPAKDLAALYPFYDITDELKFPLEPLIVDDNLRMWPHDQQDNIILVRQNLSITPWSVSLFPMVQNVLKAVHDRYYAHIDSIITQEQQTSLSSSMSNAKTSANTTAASSTLSSSTSPAASPDTGNEEGNEGFMSVKPSTIANYKAFLRSHLSISIANTKEEIESKS